MPHIYRDVSAFRDCSATVEGLTINGQPIADTPFPLFPRLSHDGRVAGTAEVHAGNEKGRLNET